MSEPTNPLPLDTTPPYPPVDKVFVDAAAQELRRVLRNMPSGTFPGTTPVPPNERLVSAKELVDGMAAAGIEKAAAALAVHRYILAGTLLPEVEKYELEVGEEWVPDESDILYDPHRRKWGDDTLQPMRRIPGRWIEKAKWEGTGPVPYDSLLVRSVPALWVEPRPALVSHIRTEATPMSAEPPSPFTIPAPEFHFVDAPIPGANGERLSWTLGELVHRLRSFAVHYQACTAAMNSGPWYERRSAFGGREANASADQVTFSAVEGMEQLRTLIRIRYDTELTIGSVNRFMNDVIRAAAGAITVSQVEKLELPQALVALSTAETPAEKRNAKTNTVKRKRGRPKATTSDPQGVGEAIKLFRDWQASNSTKKEFLQMRGIDEEDGLRTIDRGRKQVEKLGNNSAE